MNKKVSLGELYNINAEAYKDIDIDDVLFSVRVNNRLHRSGIETVGALLCCTHEDLAGINGFGAGCFKEIEIYLTSLQQKRNCEERIQESKRRKLPQSFYINRDSIASGDFSFIEGEELELIEKYKEAQEVLQTELALECIVNDIYVSTLGDVFKSFSKKYLRMNELIGKIPYSRRGKKAKYYIDVCSSLLTGKNELLEKLCDVDATLEEYVRYNVEELCRDNSPIVRFISQCDYDICVMADIIFKEVKKNERAFDIVKLRAEGQTLEQVGNAYGVTRERVRQIEKKIGQRVINWIKHNSIMQKIVADEDGNNIFFPSVFGIYFNEYADVVMFLLKVYEDEFDYVHYYKGLDIFVIGDESNILKLQDYVDSLPDQFSEDKRKLIIEEFLLQEKVPQQLINRVIEENYSKTGEVYHRSRLTLGKIYSDILKKYYSDGIWIYSDEELDGFRKHVAEDYGDIKLSENNRAIVGRIASVGILCGRGVYGPKRDKYISQELANAIHEYINESEAPIFLTNTIFNLFEEKLVDEGIDNKYYLQGVLRELFEDEYIFRRDYISKDRNITSVYSEIVAFIERAPYPVTKRQINEAFPGVTEIVLNLSVSDPEIINLFGVYVHSKKLKIDESDLRYLNIVMDTMFRCTDYMHCKDIYEYVLNDNANLLTSNGIYQAFGFYSVLEYFYHEEFEFSRPYIGKKGVKITRTFDQLHEMVEVSDSIQLADVAAMARENHFQVNSILEFANSCNKTHLLGNDKDLVAIEQTGVTEEIAKEIEKYIHEEIVETVYISEMKCISKFPKINIPWTEWLIYSVIKKWSSLLEVGVTSTTFKQAKAVVAPLGMLQLEGLDAATISGDIFMPDNMDDIDELISNIVLDEIEG